MTPEEAFNVLAPELKDDDSKSEHLQLAEIRVGKVFGEARPQAVALLAAHTLTLAKRSEQVGAYGGSVSSVSEGSLMVTFSGGGPDDHSLTTTSYGQQFLQLKRERVVSATTTGGRYAAPRGPGRL